MTVILRDERNKKFQFTLDRPCPPSRDSALPAFTTSKDTLAFLDTLRRALGNNLTTKDWSNIHDQLKLTSPKGKTAIKKQLAAQLVNNTLHLIPAKTEIPTCTTTPPRNTRLAKQNNVAQDQYSVDESYSSLTNIEPPPAKDSANDETATKNAQPGRVNATDQDSQSQDSNETIGAAPNAETETRCCPISMVSGEEVLPIEDLVLPGPFPFIWKRFYRTGHSRDSGLGHGWTHSGSEQLTLHSETVVMTDDEGRYLTFTRPRLYQRSKLINEGLDLDYVSPDCFILKQPGHGDKVFTRPKNSSSLKFRLSQLRHPAYQPAENNPFHIRNEQGFCIDFHYDAHNHLTRIESNWGKSLKINRNANGHITRLVLVNNTQHTTRPKNACRL